MSMTPGPWQAMPEEVDKPYIRIRGTVLGGRFKIANVLTTVYDGVHERVAQETRDNARAIAALPDLVEALKDMVDGFKTLRSEDFPALARARAALNKAGVTQ